VRFDAFTSGGSFTLASISAASEMCANWYAEPIGGVANVEKGPMCLTRTPGIAIFTTLPQSPNRGLWPGQNRLFAFGGNHAYEVLSTGATVDHGFVGNDGLPAQAFANGGQLFYVSAGLGWIDTGGGAQPIYFSIQLFDLAIDPSTGGLTGATGGIFDATDVGETVQIVSGTGFVVQTQAIVSVDINGEAYGASSWGTGGSTAGEGIEWLYAQPQLPASYGAFLDGYFFAAFYNTNVINFSAINDGTMWNPLDFFLKQSYPDNVSFLQADHEELYTFGDLESTEVFQDTGNANTPFEPNPGAIMHFGCTAPFSVSRLDQGLAWIGGDDRRGSRVAFLAIGFQPQRISTAAEETIWAGYSTVEDAIAYTEIYNGHEQWVVHFPSGSTVIAGQAQATPSVGATWVYDRSTQVWHQRGWWNGTFDAAGFPVLNRTRQSFHAVVALGVTETEKHYVGDWQTGQIYIQSETLRDDNGTAIYRVRICPHITQENLRSFYSRWEVDCDVTGLQRIFWNRQGYGRDRIWAMVSWQTAATGVTLVLMWSDTRGQTWVTASSQTLAVGVDVTLANAYIRAIAGLS
jgi:hypothetical protein